MLEVVQEKGNPPTVMVGMKTGAASMEYITAVPQKTKQEFSLWHSRNESDQ